MRKRSFLTRIVKDFRPEAFYWHLNAPKFVQQGGLIFHFSLTTSMINQSFHRFAILCICWDTPSENIFNNVFGTFKMMPSQCSLDHTEETIHLKQHQAAFKTLSSWVWVIVVGVFVIFKFVQIRIKMKHSATRNKNRLTLKPILKRSCVLSQNIVGSVL